MVVKTYRGLLADDGQDRIRLQTIKGKVGYRIVKLELVANKPNTETAEVVVKIFKKKQTTLTAIIDFSDSDILAIGVWSNHASATTYPEDLTVIFDNEVFNQDIYITNVDDGGSAQPINYYLELEVIPLDDAGAEYTTLKDMRQS